MKSIKGSGKVEALHAGESWRKERLQVEEFPNNRLCRLSGRRELMH